MAQWLRTPTALSNNQGSILITHIPTKKHLQP